MQSLRPLFGLGTSVSLSCAIFFSLFFSLFLSFSLSTDASRQRQEGGSIADMVEGRMGCPLNHAQTEEGAQTEEDAQESWAAFALLAVGATPHRS